MSKIGKLDLMNMTPVQALNALHELQKRLGAGREARAIRKEEGR